MKDILGSQPSETCTQFVREAKEIYRGHNKRIEVNMSSNDFVISMSLCEDNKVAQIAVLR